MILKNESFNVLLGKSEVRFGAIIQTIACYLKDGDSSSSRLEDEKHFKKQDRGAAQEVNKEIRRFHLKV